MLRQFFISETPAGYWPGELIAKIAERDLTQMQHKSDGTPGELSSKSGPIFVHERVKRDFLQFTAIPVFRMGDAEGEGKLTVRHTGAMKRSGIAFHGDADLAEPLDTPEVREALMPLDFTRLEITGTPQSCKIEMETFGGAQVVMRLPRVRRYVPMGAEQGALLIKAFEAISAAYASAAPQQSKGA